MKLQVLLLAALVLAATALPFGAESATEDDVSEIITDLEESFPADETDVDLEEESEPEELEDAQVTVADPGVQGPAGRADAKCTELNNAHAAARKAAKEARDARNKARKELHAAVKAAGGWWKFCPASEENANREGAKETCAKVNAAIQKRNADKARREQIRTEVKAQGWQKWCEANPNGHPRCEELGLSKEQVTALRNQRKAARKAAQDQARQDARDARAAAKAARQQAQQAKKAAWNQLKNEAKAAGGWTQWCKKDMNRERRPGPCRRMIACAGWRIGLWCNAGNNRQQAPKFCDPNLPETEEDLLEEEMDEEPQQEDDQEDLEVDDDEEVDSDEIADLPDDC